MEGLGHHVLLAIAVAGVAATGWRVASTAAPRGTARVLAAAVLAVSAVVLETLLLGLLGISDRPGALVAVAVAGAGAAVALTPAPAVGARAEAAAAWRGLGPAGHAATGALLSVLGGWIAWQLQHPNVGFDGETYHLPIAATWAQSGHAGSVVDAIDGLPVGNYPITNEVIVSWGLALSRSWVVASVWSPLVLALLVLAAWAGLRALGAGRGTAGLAVLAYVTSPFIITQLGGPLTDVPTSGWLIVCAALCVLSREHPRLLGVALVAAGLSFGTKTTGAVLLALTLGTALWWHRARLRELARPLAGGLLVAVLVGGLWTLRNLVDHGSPLWPFVSGPFGDPLPRGLRGYEDAFLDHPGDMLRGRTSLYLQFLSGGIVLLAGGILAPALGRTRTALAAGTAALLAVLVWSRAPFTGIVQDTQLAVGALRYLLPALAMATVALVVAARDGGPRVRRLVGAALGVAALLSANESFGTIGFPNVPSGATVTLLAVAGAAGALVLARLPRAVRALVPAALVAGAVGGLARASDGYVQRQTEAGQIDAGVLRAALARPEWRAEDFPIAMGPLTAALLRGDHLEHEVTLASGCLAPVGGWLVVVTNEASPEADRLLDCVAGDRRVARTHDFTIVER